MPPTPPVLTRCRTALADLIVDRLRQSRLRPGGPPLGDRVYQQVSPDESNVLFPCVLLTADGVAEQVRPDTNVTNLVGHPVRVLIAEKNGRQQHDVLAGVDAWREAVVSAVLYKRLAAVAESVYCEVEPQPIADPHLPLFDHLVSGLVVRCWCRVPAA